MKASEEPFTTTEASRDKESQLDSSPTAANKLKTEGTTA